MVAVHALVAEVLANLVDTLEAAHDEALQVELRGYTHVHVLIQGIEMRDKGARRGSSGNHLQGRGLHLGVSGVIQDFPDGADHRGPLQEGLFHAIVDHQVDVALAVAQLRVVELVVGHAVLIFHDGQRLETLREQCQLLGMHADLASLCAEHGTLYADEVADVEQALEYIVV